jgi:hypothetical protein
MYLVVIAWMYVVLMMSVAEATSSNGTVLGAIVTFFLYGAGPAALVAYLMGAPARNRAVKRRREEEIMQARKSASEAAGEATTGAALTNTSAQPADQAEKSSSPTR